MAFANLRSMEPSEPSLLPMPPPALTIRPGKIFAFMPDGERITVSGTGPKSTSRMVSLTTGQDIFTFEKSPSRVRRSAVLSGGAIIAFATAADCGRVMFYDTQTGQKGQTLKVSWDSDVSGLEFVPGSLNLLRAVGDNLTAIEVDEQGIYSLRPIRTLETLSDHPEYHAIAMSGDCFACIWVNPGLLNVSLLEWPSGNEIDRISWRDSQYHPRCFDHPTSDLSFDIDIVFTPGGQSLLLSKPDRSVTLWHLTGPAFAERETVWIEPSDIPQDERYGSIAMGRLSFSPDGTLLAYGLNNILSLWTWPSGMCLGKWKVLGRDPMFYQIGFSKSGSELAASFWNGPMGVHIYRVADLIS